MDRVNQISPQTVANLAAKLSTVPIWFNASSASTQVTSSMIGRTIYLDSTGGTFTTFLPGNPSDGDAYRFKDPNGNWGTTSLQVTDATPRFIEDLIASGTFSNNYVIANLIGGVFVLEYNVTNNRWVAR